MPAFKGIREYIMEDDDLPLDGDAGAVDAPIEDAPLDPGVNDEAPPPPSLEDIAANMGWSPKENWRGDPAKWKPAHEFVAATADINAKVTTKLKVLEDQLSSINRTNAAMMEKTLAEQRQKLLSERREAIEYGDVAKVDALEQELQALPVTTQPQQRTPVPEFEAFQERHSSWLNKDKVATSWAINRAEQLAKQGNDEATQLAIVERELRLVFPEYAPQPAQPKAKAVPLSQPGSRSGNPRAKTFSDLPREAQEAAISFEKKGVSRDQYVKIYFEGDA